MLIMRRLFDLFFAFFATCQLVSAFTIIGRLGQIEQSEDICHHKHNSNNAGAPIAFKRQQRLNGSGSVDNGGSNDTLDVVLFGIGDLRTDDHLGLINALQNDDSNAILPLCILNADMLANVPGAIAHTVDTANLICAALIDLDRNLKAKVGESCALHVQLTSSPLSITESLLEIRDLMQMARVRVHVHDLGDVDNYLGYGPYSYLMNGILEDDPFPIEVVAWNDNLYNEPWENIADLPEVYDEYNKKYTVITSPNKPISLDSDSQYSQQFVTLDSLKAVPSTELLLDHFVNVLDLDVERCVDECNTGLYGTHWGGLQPETVGSSIVTKSLEAYVCDCQENDKLYFLHPSYIDRQCTPNGRSLEHAAMEWQLRGDGTFPSGTAENWLAGESIVRYLAAPLLLGSVSSRRIWHMSQLQAKFFLSPMKRLAEAREWHKLLATRNIRLESAYQPQGDKVGQIKYRYWRYHGFLCRFAQLDYVDSTMCEDDSEGILLVHGFGASGSQWSKVLTEIGEIDDKLSQGFAPDLIGFGHSEKPAVSYTGYLWDSMVMDFCKEQILPKHKWKSLVVGGNSIGGFTSMSFAASDAASIATRELSSSGAPGTGACRGLVLMNSAGPVKTKAEVLADRAGAKELKPVSVAQVTALNALPACKPPPRPFARAFGNVLLSYLRPRIQSICTNLYPTNPEAVDDELCSSIYRDSLDPGAINVMVSGAKLPAPRTANELLQADFGGPPELSSADDIPESTFSGPVLIAQGVLDPLNDAMDRMERFGSLRKGITTDPLQAGHCPHDELPHEMARSISAWMVKTRADQVTEAVGMRSSASSAAR